jgi:hypothetical protein
MTDPTLYTGDVNDDDGEVLDDLLQNESNPPDRAFAESTYNDLSTAVKPSNRMVTGHITVYPTWIPTRIVNEDLERISLYVMIVSLKPSDYINIGDSKTQVDRDYAGRMYATPSPVKIFDGFTGPIWISAINAIDEISVNWWSITK